MKYYENGNLFDGDYAAPGPDAVELSDDQYQALVDAVDAGKTLTIRDGEIVAIDPLPTAADYDRAMEAHLAAERQARGYTLREPSDYAGSSVSRWAQDAADWIAHRDAVMLYGLEIMNHYAETGEAPTLAEFKAALPVIEWTTDTNDTGDVDDTGDNNDNNDNNDNTGD